MLLAFAVCACLFWCKASTAYNDMNSFPSDHNSLNNIFLFIIRHMVAMMTYDDHHAHHPPEASGTWSKGDI